MFVGLSIFSPPLLLLVPPTPHGGSCNDGPSCESHAANPLQDRTHGQHRRRRACRRSCRREADQEGFPGERWDPGRRPGQRWRHTAQCSGASFSTVQTNMENFESIFLSYSYILTFIYSEKIKTHYIYFSNTFNTAKALVIHPAPASAPIDGTSFAKRRPHRYPAATPINVRILKIAVGKRGILKNRKL